MDLALETSIFRAKLKSLRYFVRLAVMCCMSLDPSLPVGLNVLAQEHFSDSDSVRRRCAAGLHKIGTSYAVPLKTIRRVRERKLFGYYSVSGFCFKKKR